ncbi:unnamed protein product, partial [Sphenostylis stenocarpa]
MAKESGWEIVKATDPSEESWEWKRRCECRKLMVGSIGEVLRRGRRNGAHRNSDRERKRKRERRERKRKRKSERTIIKGPIQLLDRMYKGSTEM